MYTYGATYQLWLEETLQQAYTLHAIHEEGSASSEGLYGEHSIANARQYFIRMVWAEGIGFNYFVERLNVVCTALDNSLCLRLVSAVLSAWCCVQIHVVAKA